MKKCVDCLNFDGLFCMMYEMDIHDIDKDDASSCEDYEGVEL